MNLSQLSIPARVSVKYGLSLEQSEVLVSHLLRAKAGDMSAMVQLGFEKQDMIAIFEGQNPSASTLRTLSERLNIGLLQSHRLIQDIKADALIARESMM